MQQRGVPGVVTILKQCLQGVSIPEGAEVHVFDLTPNRFAEWSRAVWDRQLHNLKNPDACVEKFTYTGYFAEPQEADTQRKDMIGRGMEDKEAVLAAETNIYCFELL